MNTGTFLFTLALAKKGEIKLCFAKLISKKIDIQSIDKAKLLVALFNNAKNSALTQSSIGNIICPDKFVRDMLPQNHEYKKN